MNDSQKRHLAEQVRRLRARFVQSMGAVLCDVLPTQSLMQWVFDLYHARWQIELDLRSIKTSMRMDALRCKSPQMLEKEIAVYLLAYNLVRSAMAQAAYLGRVLPRQLSFKEALQPLNAFEENLRHCPLGRLALQHAHLFAGIAQMKLPHRPGQVEPGALKRRPKPFQLLTEPRQILRVRLIEQQQRHIAACLS